MAPEPTIRAASFADRDSVLELFAEHLGALGYAPDPALDRDMATFPELYEKEGGAFLIACDAAGRAIAMGGRRSGEIVRVYVRPRHRRSGLARRIIGRLVDSAEGPVSAVVARNNPAALACFAASGFALTGRSPEHPKMRHCEILERST